MIIRIKKKAKCLKRAKNGISHVCRHVIVGVI